MADSVLSERVIPDRPVPDLRERRRRQTRLDINSAALDLFERKGVAATTVDEIAQAAGVSPSTFFRQFKTKEESILSVDLDLDFAVETEIRNWVDVTPASSIDLAGMESIYEKTVVRQVDSSTDIKNRILRTRRLIVGDAHLRVAAIAVDAATLCRLTDALVAKLDGRELSAFARLLVESAGMTLRVAFDEWATRIDAGEDADLGEIYRTTCAEIRRLSTGTCSVSQ